MDYGGGGFMTGVGRIMGGAKKLGSVAQTLGSVAAGPAAFAASAGKMVMENANPNSPGGKIYNTAKDVATTVASGGGNAPGQLEKLASQGGKAAQAAAGTAASNVGQGVVRAAGSDLAGLAKKVESLGASSQRAATINALTKVAEGAANHLFDVEGAREMGYSMDALRRKYGFSR